jgi:hypothetical protein
MESILQGLQDLDGVLGVIAVGPTGQVVGYRSHAVYDAVLLQQVSTVIATAIDSVQLLQEDWETVTANYADGRIIIRNLATSGAGPRNGLKALAVIADGRLNLSFAGVAIRVAVTKLKALTVVPNGPPSGLGQPPPPVSAHTMSSPIAAPPSSAHAASTAAPRAEIAGSGLSWSGLGGSSAMAASGVAVADAASAAYLTGCTKALARSVGPMAKTFVKEAIRRMWPGRAFSRDLGAALAVELERHIEDRADLTEFRKAVKGL